MTRLEIFEKDAEEKKAEMDHCVPDTFEAQPFVSLSDFNCTLYTDR